MVDKRVDEVNNIGDTTFGIGRKFGSAFYPIGAVGRFFSHFFANKAIPYLTDDELPRQSQETVEPHPLAGDTVISADVIKTETEDLWTPTGDRIATSKPILPKLESARKERYAVFEKMDHYPEISCLVGDSLVYTLKWGWKAVKELAELGEEFHVLSYDKDSRSLIPAKATKAMISAKEGHDKAMVKVTLDNGNQITCTYDHPFLTKDEKWVEASKLVIGERLMPGNVRIRHLNEETSSQQYWQVHQPHADSKIRSGDGKRWTWIHRLVGDLLLGNKGKIVHHEDHNPLNNDPDNLELLTVSEHAKEHISFIDNTHFFPEWTEERRKLQSRRMLGNTHRKGATISQSQKDAISRATKGPKSEEHKRKIGESQPNKIHIPIQDIEAAIHKEGTIAAAARALGVSWSYVKRKAEKHDLLSSNSNHRVVAVEHIEGNPDVYDLHVPGYHNFICNGVVVHNTAFDIFADDSTQKDLKGKVFTVNTDNLLMKREVSNLFDNLKMDHYVWDITRNACKYGDCFIELVVDLHEIKAGVQHLKILNPLFIYRVENEYGYLTDFLQEIPNSNDWSVYGAVGNEMASRQYITLDKDQIVHFKLDTSDPAYYPYGRSIAAGARSVFNSLKMMEDAMLIYRLQRAPERRVFYVDVGQMPTGKANVFMEEVKRKFKKEKYYDNTRSTIGERYNPLCITGDTKIPTLDGKVRTVEQIIEDTKDGDTIEVWASDGKKLVPAVATKPFISGRNAKMVRVTLDNGKTLDCTPEHKLLLRDGSYLEAQYAEGKSIFPFYSRMSPKGYLEVQETPGEGWKNAHRVIAKASCKVEDAEFSANYANHKVTSVEVIEDSAVVYDLTVNIHHNFAIDAGIVIHNSQDEDFFLPVKGNKQGTKIETLPGAQNLGDVDDVKYFRDKLLAGLKIPKDYIVEKDKSPERKSNLSQLDVKFARTITRVQKNIELGLTEIAKKHLLIKEFPPLEVSKLTIELSEPGDMFIKRKLDIEDQRTSVVSQVQNLGLFSQETIYKQFYDMNETEQSLEKDRIRKEMDDPIFQFDPGPDEEEQGMGGSGGQKDKSAIGNAQQGGDINTSNTQGLEPAENNSPTANESLKKLTNLREQFKNRKGKEKVISLLDNEIKKTRLLIEGNITN